MSASAVFAPRRHAAADVALRLVDIEHFFDPGAEQWVELSQALGDILMYGRHE
jgi:hypothetical protein